GQRRTGVFIFRRDTNSRLNALAGGRLFPGVHHHAAFSICETPSHFEVAVESDDGGASLAVTAELADRWAPTSLFGSLADASSFFEAGSIGYSPSNSTGRFQGLELKCAAWQMHPLTPTIIRSSWFDDPAVFPPGTAELDCALLMRGIEHEWHSQHDLCC